MILCSWIREKAKTHLIFPKKHENVTIRVELQWGDVKWCWNKRWQRKHKTRGKSCNTGLIIILVANRALYKGCFRDEHSFPRCAWWLKTNHGMCMGNKNKQTNKQKHPLLNDQHDVVLCCCCVSVFKWQTQVIWLTFVSPLLRAKSRSCKFITTHSNITCTYECFAFFNPLQQALNITSGKAMFKTKRTSHKVQSKHDQQEKMITLWLYRTKLFIGKGVMNFSSSVRREVYLYVIIGTSANEGRLKIPQRARGMIAK